MAGGRCRDAFLTIAILLPGFPVSRQDPPDVRTADRQGIHRLPDHDAIRVSSRWSESIICLPIGSLEELPNPRFPEVGSSYET